MRGSASDSAQAKPSAELELTQKSQLCSICHRVLGTTTSLSTLIKSIKISGSYLTTSTSNQSTQL